MYSRALFGLAAAAGTMISAGAVAQTSNTAADTGVVDEVIVTAQRREERLVDVPISMSALPAEALVNAGVRTTLDIPKLVPGVEVSHNGVWVSPAIRGVTTRVGENSVAQYVDGVYIPNPVTALNEFAAVERVDVLKGPQGTLFGRNATGGAIMIMTADPSVNSFQTRVSANVEERSGYGGSGYINVPVADNFAFNVAVNYRESDGWIKEGRNTLANGTQPLSPGTPLNAIQHSGQRVKLLWTPNELTDVLLTYWHGELRDPGAVVYPAISNTLAGNVGNLGRNVALANLAPINRANFDQLTLKINREFGDFNFSSLSAYRDDGNFIRVDVGQTLAPPIVASWDSTQRTLSQEFIFQGRVGAFEPVFGLFLYQDDFSKRYLSAAQVAGQEAFSVAPFVDLTWHATDDLALIAGVRYTHEKREFDYRRTAVGGDIVFDKEKNYSNVSPRVVARYTLDNGANVYGSISRGFKSGLFNTDATGLSSPDQLAAQPLEAEKITTYEVGFKRSVAEYDFSTAVFYYDWTNIQTNRYLNGNTIAQNAAAAEIYGAEAQISYNFSPDFQLYANASLLHARYSSFRDANASVTPGTVGNLYNPNDPTGPLVVAVAQDWTDERMLLAPDYAFNVGFNWKIPVGAGTVEVAPNARYSSEYAPNGILLNTSGDNVLNVDSRTLVDLTLSYLPNEHLTVSAYARNLLDEKYYAEPNYNVLGIYGLWGEPRTVGLRVSYNY
ncbi:TonB-dependent receptor [Steroidobacter sp.]|uniref:TonB-dependent receptor n=1 Tax=Steroidobacter sp. TaxID=1978227 RepID=UPI001A55B7C5|nr:TonB-dependent receptor [Steroidobacter sp.]MBL8267744.1 TonB-dependent receptor [Steroidobacter sp.]